MAINKMAAKESKTKIVEIIILIILELYGKIKVDLTDYFDTLN